MQKRKQTWHEFLKSREFKKEKAVILNKIKKEKKTRLISHHAAIRQMTKAAIKSGSIPIKTACDHCKNPVPDGYSLHVHHVDYNSHTNILWLCPRCHSAEHSRIAKMFRDERKRVTELYRKQIQDDMT